MKSNKLYASLAMIAFLLVFVAGTAKAQVFQTEPCDANSTTMTQPIETPPLSGCFYDVTFCYDCPEGVGDHLNVRIESITGSPGCTNFGAAEDALYEWLTDQINYNTLCPQFGDIPPCGSGHWLTMNIIYPRCNTLEYLGNDRWLQEGCPGELGTCTHTYTYCFNNGVIYANPMGVTASHTYECPTYDRTSIWALINTLMPVSVGYVSPCFHACN